MHLHQIARGQAWGSRYLLPVGPPIPACPFAKTEDMKLMSGWHRRPLCNSRASHDGSDFLKLTTARANPATAEIATPDQNAQK